MHYIAKGDLPSFLRPTKRSIEKAWTHIYDSGISGSNFLDNRKLSVPRIEISLSNRSWPLYYSTLIKEATKSGKLG